MEERISSRLSRTEGRKFAFTVGPAFLGLGLLAWYRGHGIAAVVLSTIGAALGLAGATAPTCLGPVLRAWMRLAQAIAKVTTPVFMGIVYFGVFTPLSFVMRLAGRNVLVHRAGEEGYWIRLKEDRNQTNSMERQF